MLDANNVMNYISNSDTSLLASRCKALSFFQVKVKQGKIFFKANILKPAINKPQNFLTNQMPLYKCVCLAACTLTHNILTIPSLAGTTKNLVMLIQPIRIFCLNAYMWPPAAQLH